MNDVAIVNADKHTSNARCRLSSTLRRNKNGTASRLVTAVTRTHPSFSEAVRCERIVRVFGFEKKQRIPWYRTVKYGTPEAGLYPLTFAMVMR